MPVLRCCRRARVRLWRPPRRGALNSRDHLRDAGRRAHVKAPHSRGVYKSPQRVFWSTQRRPHPPPPPDLVPRPRPGPPRPQHHPAERRQGRPYPSRAAPARARRRPARRAAASRARARALRCAAPRRTRRRAPQSAPGSARRRRAAAHMAAAQVDAAEAALHAGRWLAARGGARDVLSAGPGVPPVELGRALYVLLQVDFQTGRCVPPPREPRPRGPPREPQPRGPARCCRAASARSRAAPPGVAAPRRPRARGACRPSPAHPSRLAAAPPLPPACRLTDLEETAEYYGLSLGALPVSVMLLW
jgi:hypothetical protein